MHSRNAIGLRLSAAALAIFFLTAVAGCNGPTKTGQQARADATLRMELVHAQMAYDQARQAFASGQLEKSLKLCDTAIARTYAVSSSGGTLPEGGGSQIDPAFTRTVAPYHLLRGRILFEQHLLEPALESLSRSLELDPTLAEAHYFSGIIFERWSNPERATEEYRSAWDLDNTKVQYLLAAAEMLITTQRLTEAQQLIEPRLAYFEHNAALRQLLGQIALLQGDHAKAAKLLSQARLLNPEDNLLLEELARAHFAAGQYPQAHYSITQLQKLVGGERPDFMQLQARCLVMMDRTSEARNIYLRLSQLTPADPSVWIELGNVAFEVGDFRRVASCATHTIALAPDRFEGYLLKGLYEQHADNLTEAVRQFRKAADLAPDVAWPHLLLGMALEAAGEQDRSVLAYGAAVRADPTNAEALRRLERLGDPSRGVGLAAEHSRDSSPE